MLPLALLGETDGGFSMPVGTDATTFPTYTITINDVSCHCVVLSRLVLIWNVSDRPDLGLL